MITRRLAPLGIGLLLAGLTYSISVLLPKELVLYLHATLLAAIGSVYVDFAIADGRTLPFVLESTVALVFVGVAAFGLHYDPHILVFGWIAHGIWDLIHHSHDIPGQFADWYIPLCLSFDLMVGFYLLLLI